MPDTTFDWSQVSGQATKRLRAPKVTPVPEGIVAEAQRSWDGVKDDENPEGDLLHVLSYEFSSEEVAKEFAKLVKKAGDHTVPLTTVTVVPDPDRDGNTRKVNIKAGQRRGRATTN